MIEQHQLITSNAASTTEQLSSPDRFKDGEFSLEYIVNMQSLDPIYKPILEYLQKGVLPPSQRLAQTLLVQSCDYAVINGILMHTGIAQSSGLRNQNCYKIALPIILVKQVVEWFHGLPVSEHVGVRETIDQIQEHYFSPYLSTMVTNYVKSCQICVTQKTCIASKTLSTGEKNCDNAASDRSSPSNENISATKESVCGDNPTMEPLLDSITDIDIEACYKDYWKEVTYKIERKTYKTVPSASDSRQTSQRRQLFGKTANRKCALYVRNISRRDEDSQSDIIMLVKDYARRNDVTIDHASIVMNMYTPYTVGCRILVDPKAREKVLASKFWPAHVSCRKWSHKQKVTSE